MVITRVVCGKACSFSLLKSVGYEAGGRRISCLQLQGKEWHAYRLSFPRCRHLVNDLKILMPHSRTGIYVDFPVNFSLLALEECKTYVTLCQIGYFWFLTAQRPVKLVHCTWWFCHTQSHTYLIVCVHMKVPKNLTRHSRVSES